jgi:hypothetical protein
MLGVFGAQRPASRMLNVGGSFLRALGRPEVFILPEMPIYDRCCAKACTAAMTVACVL